MRKVGNGTVSVSVPGRDGLTGHSFGNLFLTAMSEITGDLGNHSQF